MTRPWQTIAASNSLVLLAAGQEVHDGSDGADEHDDECPDKLVVPYDAPLGLKKIDERKHDQTELDENEGKDDQHQARGELDRQGRRAQYHFIAYDPKPGRKRRMLATVLIPLDDGPDPS